jgi:PAS domain S-box-containing protein
MPDFLKENFEDSDQLNYQASLVDLIQSVANLGHWIYDLENESLFWSKQIYSIHGVAKEKYKPDIKTAVKFYHPDDLPLVEDSLAASINEKKGFEFELRIITPAGEMKYVHAKGEPQLNKNREVKVLIGIFQDITKRVMETRTLNNIQLSRDTFINASSDGYWDWYISDDYEYMSPRFWEILGIDYKTKTHHPSEWQELIFPDDLEMALKNFNKHVKTKGKHPYNQEVRYLHSNGSTVYILCRGKVVEWNEDGSPHRMIGTHTDITELKRKDFELIKQKEELQLIFDNTPANIFYKDDKNNIILLNNSAASSLGGKPEDFTGKNCIELYGEKMAAKYLEDDLKVFHSGQAMYNIIERYTPVNGPQGWVQTHKIPSVINNTMRLLVIAEDITERVQSEQEKDLLINKLQSSNEELERFAYMASHDLKEPLRMVQSFTKRLQEKYTDKLDEKANKYIEFAVDGATRMHELILDLLEYSRVSNEIIINEPTDLNEVLDYVLSNLRTAISESKAEVNSIELPVVMINKTRFSSVLQNLIGNALKYQQPKNQPVVNINYTEDPQKYTFTVEDNGLGISKEHYQKIFVPFMRLHNKNEYAGTGIGLSITQKIIKSEGGSIWLESEYGKGTKFYFTVPKKST